MAYLRRIIIYESDFTTPDDAVYSSGVVSHSHVFQCEAHLAAMGGCLGAILQMPGNVRTDPILGRRQFVEIYFDDDTLVYSGFVVGRPREVSENTHEYDLRGLSDQLSEINFPAIDVQGADVDGSTIGTVGELVEYIFSEVAYGGTGILYDAALVTSAIPIDSFEIAKDVDLASVFTRLAYIARDGGDMVVWGVRPDRKFYFHAISTAGGDLQDTITVGTNCTRGRERSADEQTINKLVVTADINKLTGYLSKKTFTHASAAASGQSRARIAHVAGIYQQADMSRFADGWFLTWANPGITVENIQKNPGATTAPPFPWAGRLKYSDEERGDLVTTYFGSARYSLRLFFEYEATLGIGTPDDLVPVDQYAPSVIDDLTAPTGGGGVPGPTGSGGGGGGGAGAGGGQGGYDAVMQLPDATDETTAPEDTPRLVVESDDLGGGGGGGGAGSSGLARGQVVEFSYPGGARYNPSISPQELLWCVARVANGGTTALPANAVRFHFLALDEAQAVIATTSFLGELVQTENGIETWGMGDGGYEITEPGWVHVGLQITISESPDTYLFYPNEDAGAPDWDNAPWVRVIDPSGDGTATSIGTLVVGWRVDGG